MLSLVVLFPIAGALFAFARRPLAARLLCAVHTDTFSRGTEKKRPKDGVISLGS